MSDHNNDDEVVDDFINQILNRDKQSNKNKDRVFRNAEEQVRRAKAETEANKIVSDGQNNKEINKVLTKVIKIIIWIIVFCFFVFSLIFSWHLIAPEDWRWLSKEDFEKLKDLLLAASVSGFATSLANKVKNYENS